MEREPTVGPCAICGRPLTQVGPKGECLRCLADLGFLSGSQEPGQSETPRRLTPGPLKYDHFEVEVGVDGFGGADSGDPGPGVRGDGELVDGGVPDTVGGEDRAGADGGRLGGGGKGE